MTRNTPTIVAWCLPALLAASIITCLPGIDNHLHRELLSPRPAYIRRLYQFPMETNYVWREQCSDDCLLFLNPPVPRGVLRKSIRGMMPSNCLYKKWWHGNRQVSASGFDRCQTSTFWIERWLVTEITCVDPPVGTHLKVLSKSYPINTNMTGFR